MAIHSQVNSACIFNFNLRLAECYGEVGAQTRLSGHVHVANRISSYNSVGMNYAKVFISSVMNPAVEDLRPEREAVRRIVESYPFLKAWAFEEAPASTDAVDEYYLRNVDESDAVILIVGCEATNPVAAELERALRSSKPIMVVRKSVQNRKPLAQSLLAQAGRKYVDFCSIEELESATRAALNQALVDGLRSLSQRGAPSMLGRLRKMADRKTKVHVRPIIPVACVQDLFQIEEATADTVALTKLGSGHNVRLPTGRVTEVIDLGNAETPTLPLNGRLQWIAPTLSWVFFEEKPDPSSLLGFAKMARPDDPRAEAIKQKLPNFKFYWDRETNLSTRFAEGWTVVYDTDGRYFKITSRPSDQVLIIWGL